MSAPISLTTEIVRYGYWFLFPAVLIEGPISIFAAGAVTALGHFSFWLTFLVVVIADKVADIFLYLFGRFGRRYMNTPFAKSLGITPKRLLAIEKKFAQDPAKVLFIGKASHGPGGAILVAAGVARMPFWTFMMYNLTATMIKSLIILALGYYFGGTGLPFETYFRWLTVISFIIFLVIGWRYGKTMLGEEEPKKKAR